ncbi:ThiF family adenylyltransferase [Candidatus Palauibacter sp.]|uniref:ThiF family adenylyltransferase n=1 Tax=Candidatus Palauibacter sp. TaxID=3101350 RepID=UPI003AF297BD
MLQVGAGAVGSSTIYFLGLMGASAELLVLDHDVVKVENLDRSLLFGLDDASPHEIPKVEAVVRAAESFPALRVHPVRSRWADYVAAGYRVGEFDLALALANEDHVWSAMAEAVLPLTLQATTDRDWGVAFGAHSPGTGYCLRCRFPPDTPVMPTICAEGEIEIESAAGQPETVHASLPFQSAAAAGLLAVEIDKLALGPAAGGPNYVEGRIDVTENVLSLHRTPSRACPACRNFPEDLWAVKYERTRFASFR